ncbi:hypothetical protein BC938DRAFT_473601 [Jimgerdemannia flammicorona]|uniref:Uncharacterized protein n=1 Tax=Jimgerdemannia flammicorona TaxID=994334 RepID=A0A433Q3P6_9FUNG|nr:hypothetical protein BC938DRAFT_473601 [Jimgerdemannia flammicorona]
MSLSVGDLLANTLSPGMSPYLRSLRKRVRAIVSTFGYSNLQITHVCDPSLQSVKCQSVVGRPATS